MNKGLCTVSHASVHFRQHEHNVYFASLFHVIFFCVALACCLFLSLTPHSPHKLYLFSVLVPSTRFGTLTSGRILNELKLWACFIEFTMAHCKVCHLVSFPSLPNTIHFHIQTSPTDCRSAGLISHSKPNTGLHRTKSHLKYN